MEVACDGLSYSRNRYPQHLPACLAARMPRFDEREDATHVTFPAGVTHIPAGFFSNNTEIEGIKGSVVITGGITSIGELAFHRCDDLTSITLSDSVTELGDRVFQYCLNLTSITILGDVTKLGKGVFENCPTLGENSIRVPNLPDIKTLLYASFDPDSCALADSGKLYEPDR